MKNTNKLTLIAALFLLLAGGLSSAHAQSFAGTWNTVTSKGKKMIINLQMVGRTSEVTGSYPVSGLTQSNYQPTERPADVFVTVSFTNAASRVQSISSIKGTVTDKVLRFKWQEDGGQGSGKFTLSADGQSFQGTFSKTNNPDDTSGGTWNGIRVPRFDGVWQAGQYPTLLLQQNVTQVAGQLYGGRPDMGEIRAGSINGNTLRFTVWRPAPPGLRMPDQYMGTGELVIATDGKSFKGTILGVTVSGSRVTR
ncbi:MAG: hypothetical protein QM785_08530 [Pyrinomonadaceae bacterium]